ncbi:MAG: hypothetical protein RMK29_10060 [Myxococcales bacterium]|nr:hypothetical protein [Myxococcota bacterium]MDW8282046.1 hypothetical protein [Myxococcales bacterium]
MSLLLVLSGCVEQPPVPRTCASIENDYKALTESPANQRCSDASECQVLSGQCGAALGTCYHALNRNVTQEMLNALGDEYRRLDCVGSGPVCRCPRPPSVECRAGVCTLVL